MIKLKDIIGLPSLQYHVDNRLSLHENVYRYSSNNFISLFTEARDAWRDGLIELNAQDINLIETTDIGLYGEYNGQRVPLDLPMLDEQGADTSWDDGEGNKITLQDILDMTKNIPQKEYPTEKLAKIVLNWDDNPEEIDRISQVEISKQYPILIMADESGKIKWILDGNHRAQKALRSKSETIPAKIIKPSNLDAKAKKVLLDIPMLEGEVDYEKEKTWKIQDKFPIKVTARKGWSGNYYTIKPKPMNISYDAFMDLGSGGNVAYTSYDYTTGEALWTSDSLEQIKQWEEDNQDKIKVIYPNNIRESYDYDEVAQSEFGMDYDQLGSGEKEWVRDEIDNMSMNESLNEKEGVPHYTKDGKEWKGKLHKMPDGSLMSGNPHDEGGSGADGKSEKLYHKDDLNEDENPCWKGYEMVGMKTKNGKEVPNCVPKNEAKVNEGGGCGCGCGGSKKK